MKCAICQRKLSKIAAVSRGKPVGPTCAKRAGLTAPKKRESATTRATVQRELDIDPSQIPLFESLPSALTPASALA